jgi:hypothetical protein
MDAHSFYVQFLFPGTMNNRWIVSMWISKGSGNYYVIYYKNGDADAGGYIQVPADADEQWFLDRKDIPLYDLGDLSQDTESYGQWIFDNVVDGGIGLFDATTDGADEASDFMNSNVLTLP